MTPLRTRMIEDMTSAGLTSSTQATYIQAVRRLAAYYQRSPELLSEAEVRAYLLYLRDGRGAARGSFRPHHGGIQFFFAGTLDRDWSLFSKKESNNQSTEGCRSFSPTPKRARSLAA
jgi:integrase/recombinase XerD